MTVYHFDGFRYKLAPKLVDQRPASNSALARRIWYWLPVGFWGQAKSA